MRPFTIVWLYLIGVMLILTSLIGCFTSFMAWLNLNPQNEAFWWHYSAIMWNGAFLLLMLTNIYIYQKHTEITGATEIG